MLDKAIKYNKEYRKPYHKGKAVDSRCRNHGSCNRCRDNRLHSRKTSEYTAREQINEKDIA